MIRSARVNFSAFMRHYRGLLETPLICTRDIGLHSKVKVDECRQSQQHLFKTCSIFNLSDGTYRGIFPLMPWKCETCDLWLLNLPLLNLINHWFPFFRPANIQDLFLRGGTLGEGQVDQPQNFRRPELKNGISTKAETPGFICGQKMPRILLKRVNIASGRDKITTVKSSDMRISHCYGSLPQGMRQKKQKVFSAI